MTTPLHNTQKSAVALSTAGPSPSSSIQIDAKELDQRLAPSQDIKVNGLKIGALEIAPFLRKVYAAITEQFGPPSRFDLTGGALATLAEGTGAIQDIDISIEYPESHTPRLREFRACLQKAMGFPKDKEPFFRKSQVPDPDFTAALLSCGDEESFWIDFTITTKKKRSHLFRKDDIRASLLPYLLHQLPITVESTEHDAATVLQDRKNKRIVIVRPEEINHMGWPLLLLSLAKGNTLETTSAEPILQATFQNYVKSGKEGALSIIKRVFASHGHPSVRARFYLSAFLSLLKSSTDQELKYFADECSKKKSFDAFFLNYGAHNCLPNKERRPQLTCLAYLLDLSAYPKPTDEEWKKFLSTLKQASWIEKQFPTHIQEPLHKLAFAKILSTADFNQKKCLDALYKRLTPDELKSLLPQRVAYELPLSPELAISTYQNHYSHLSPETRLTFINALLTPKKQSFLFTTLEIERTNQADDFPAFLAQFPKEKAAIPFLLHSIDKTPISELLPLLHNYKNEPQIDSFLRQKAPTLLETQKESSLSAILFLARFLPKEKEEKIFLFLNQNLFPLPKATDDIKESLQELWPALCPYLSDKNRTALLSVLKKWGLTLKESDLPTLLSLSEPLIESLLKDAQMEREVRTRLMNQLLLLKEKSGKFEEALQLYHEKKHLFTSDPEKLFLYRSLSPHSLIKPSLYLDLESPPIEDFETNTARLILDKKWETLLLYVQLAIRLHHPSLISCLSQIEGCAAEIIELLSQIPHLITAELLQKITLHSLPKPSAKKFFETLLSPSAPDALLPFLEPLYEYIDPSFRCKHIPSLVKKLLPCDPPTQKKHLSAAVLAIPWQKWEDYPKIELPSLHLLLGTDPQFSEIRIALLIFANTEESLKRAAFLLEENFHLEMALALTPKIVAFGFPMLVSTVRFFQRIESALQPNVAKFIEALSIAKTPFLLRYFISTLLKYNPGTPFEGREKNWLISAVHKLHELDATEELFYLVEFEDNLSLLPKGVTSIIAKTIEKRLDKWSSERHQMDLEMLIYVGLAFTAKIFLGYQKNDRWLFQQLEKQLDFLLDVMATANSAKVFIYTIANYFLELYHFADSSYSDLTKEEDRIAAYHLLSMKIRENSICMHVEHLLFAKMCPLFNKLPHTENTEFLLILNSYLLSLEPSSNTYGEPATILKAYTDLFRKNSKDNERVYLKTLAHFVKPTHFHFFYGNHPDLVIEQGKLLRNLDLPPASLGEKWNVIKTILANTQSNEVLIPERIELLEDFFFRQPPFFDKEEAETHLKNVSCFTYVALPDSPVYVKPQFVAMLWLSKKLSNARDGIAFLKEQMGTEEKPAWVTDGTRIAFKYIEEMASKPYFDPFFALGLNIFTYLLHNDDVDFLHDSIFVAFTALNNSSLAYPALSDQLESTFRQGIERILRRNPDASLVNNLVFTYGCVTISRASNPGVTAQQFPLLSAPMKATIALGFYDGDRLSSFISTVEGLQGILLCRTGIDHLPFAILIESILTHFAEHYSQDPERVTLAKKLFTEWWENLAQHINTPTEELRAFFTNNKLFIHDDSLI